MARYIRDFHLEDNAQEAYEAVLKLLNDNGYRKKDYEYDDVYTKGKGVLSNPKFFKISLAGQVLRVEAWGMVCYSFGVFGSERYGADAKAHMQQDLEKIDALLADFGARCDGVVPPATQNYSSPPLVSGEENRKEFRKSHLCLSLIKELRSLMVTACIAAVLLAALGLLAADTTWDYVIISALSLLALGDAIFMYAKRSYWGGLGLMLLSALWVAVCVASVFFAPRALLHAASWHQSVLYGGLIGAVYGVFAAIWGMVGVGTYMVFRKIHKYFRYFVKGKK